VARKWFFESNLPPLSDLNSLPRGALSFPIVSPPPPPLATDFYKNFQEIYDRSPDFFPSGIDAGSSIPYEGLLFLAAIGRFENQMSRISS